jgi:hypothetical protein
MDRQRTRIQDWTHGIAVAKYGAMTAGNIVLMKFLPVMLPLAVKWVEYHERKILRSGVPLGGQELADAARVGVKFPEKIRLMHVDRIPLLNSEGLRLLALLLPMLSPNTVGLSLGYGIYVRSRWSHHRELIAHECVHTGQYERYGSTTGFLRAYLGECLQFGYLSAPLELEAIERSASLRTISG